MKELLTKLKEMAKKAGALEMHVRESNGNKKTGDSFDACIIFKTNPVRPKTDKAEPATKQNLLQIANEIMKDAGVTCAETQVYGAFSDPCVWLLRVRPATDPKPATQPPTPEPKPRT